MVLFVGIRADERKILEKAAYVQSISSATAPVVPVMASVFTFLALVLTGNDLSPVDVSDLHFLFLLQILFIII